MYLAKFRTWVCGFGIPKFLPGWKSSPQSECFEERGVWVRRGTFWNENHSVHSSLMPGLCLVPSSRRGDHWQVLCGTRKRCSWEPAILVVTLDLWSPHRHESQLERNSFTCSVCENSPQTWGDEGKLTRTVQCSVPPNSRLLLSFRSPFHCWYHDATMTVCISYPCFGIGIGGYNESVEDCGQEGWCQRLNSCPHATMSRFSATESHPRFYHLPSSILGPQATEFRVYF